MKENENIFGTTPAKKEENNKESDKKYCIFDRKEKKENNPVKIINPTSIKQSQVFKQEDNKKIKTDNYIKNMKNNFNNNNERNELNSKTTIIKKNVLKNSINLNIIDYNGSTYNHLDNNINKNINNNNNIDNYSNINNTNNDNINNNIINNDLNNIILNKENNIKNNNNENNGNNNNDNNTINNNNNDFNNININNNNNLVLNYNIDNNEINKLNNGNNIINNYNKSDNINNNKNIKNNNNNMNNNIIEINNNITKNNLKDNHDNIPNGLKKNNSNKNIKIKELQSNKDEGIDIKEMIIKTHTNKVKKKYNEEEIQKRKKEEELSRAQVKDHLRCYICLNNVKKPRMCKSCKKLACEQCLKNWLLTKNKCGFCRKIMKFSDTIYIPILDDLSEFFIEEAEKQPANDNYNSYIFEKSQVAQDDNNNENKIMCNEHNNKCEYFCVHCNKNLCSKCLVFINEESQKHRDHILLPIEKLNNKDIKEILDEYNKLYISKQNIDNLISLCNLKKRELEIEKNQNINNLDSIKKDINVQLDNRLNNITKKFGNLQSIEEEYSKALENTPFALRNIVKSKDHGQGQKIYEHINNLNKAFNKNYNEIYLTFHKNYIESFISEQFELILPQGGNYVENLELFNKTVDNFIPDCKCQITLKYKSNNISFNIYIKNINNNQNNNIIKYYGFIIIKNKHFDCEFARFEDKGNYSTHLLRLQFNSNHFITFKDENNIIRFKTYILKHEMK